MRVSHALALCLTATFAIAGAAAGQPKTPRDGEAELRRLGDDGFRALGAGRYADARASFTRALELAPGHPGALLGLAEALFWLGEWERALPIYERVTTLTPEVAHAHNGIGHTCLNLARQLVSRPRRRAQLLAQAEQAFARALELDPTHSAARDGARIVAEMRATAGHPLGALQWLALALVALLGAAYLWHARGGLRALGPALRRLGWPLALFALTRALLLLAFALAPALLPEAPTHPLPVLQSASSFVLDSVAGRWDANLYAVVAIEGYAMAEPGSAAWGTVGQFPLLPALFRGLAFALDDYAMAALLLPNAALLCACLLLFSLVEREHGRRLAIGATLALRVHPGSLYGSVLYAESLLLLGAVGAIESWRRGRALTAALWAMFAGLARINALALLPWLVLEAWRTRRERPVAGLALACAPALSVAVFALYLQLVLGDALAYVRELRGTRFEGAAFFVALQEAGVLWHHLLGSAGARPLPGPPAALVMAVVVVAAYGVALYRLLRARAFGPALFVAGGMALAATSSLAAQPRYLWVLFPALPCFAALADRRGVRLLVPLVSLGGLLAAAVAFARWYYVT